MIPTFLKKLLNLFAPNVDVEPLPESKKVEVIEEIRPPIISSEIRGTTKPLLPPLGKFVFKKPKKKSSTKTPTQKPKRKNKLQRQSRKKNR